VWSCERAVAAEAEALSGLALRSKAHWGYDDAFIEACRAELRVLPENVEHHRLTVAVHRETGRIVGFSGLVGTSSEDAELSALFVEPEAIGTGVGRLLFDHAVGVADQLGVDQRASALRRGCLGSSTAPVTPTG
jgi:GNAT superfamily N-acetyltransferase